MAKLNSDFPGLCWRKRKDGTKLAVWVASNSPPHKSFRPRSIRLWSGIEPTKEDMEKMGAKCRHWHEQMHSEGRKRAPNTRRKPTGVVYFLEGGDLIKIGYSGGLERRLKLIQSQIPFVKLRLLGTIPGTRTTELHVHDLFAKERQAGEWFRRSEFLLQYIERECGNKQGTATYERQPEHPERLAASVAA